MSTLGRRVELVSMRLSGLLEELSLVSSVQRDVALAFFTSIGARLAFVTDLAPGSQDSPGVGALAGVGLALRELARKTCRESKIWRVSIVTMRSTALPSHDTETHLPSRRGRAHG